MGVDARIFVRIKGRQHWLDPKNELQTAYSLASTMGAENFWISNGEFGGKHHCLAIMKPYADKAEAEDYGQPEEYVGSVVWTQDGDPIVAEEDEQFIQVFLAGRYYSEGYARGDWPTLRMIIEWLAHRFPAGSVWYGGDSSGCCAEEMTLERMAQMNDFFLDSGNRTYQRAFARAVDRHTGQPAPMCDLCQVMTVNCGGGQGESFWFCDGCGRNVVTSKTGARWLKRGEDFFERHKTPS